MKPPRIAMLAAAAAIVSAICSQRLPAQEPEKMKLAAGLELGASYQMEQLVKTTMSGGKQDHTTTQNYTLTVFPHGKDKKEKLVRSRVDRVRVETNATADGQRTVYDTADRKKQNPSLAEMAKGMMSVTSGAIYAEDDSFKAFEGGAPTDQGTRSAMQKLTDLGFPDEPVGPGDAWKHQVEAQMGQMGTVKYELDYKFTKIVRHEGARCAVLAISGSMATIPGAAGGEGFDLKSRTLRGVMYFDPKLGAVRKYEINAQLDLTAYGKKMPGSMTIRTVLTKFIPGPVAKG